ncbi:hypothetical protein OF83DRAFT_168885 [Amylostereum chailletii]|nr:hypothetical protein OF83DRAFT_168885 [Amylostereum chailletii]
MLKAYMREYVDERDKYATGKHTQTESSSHEVERGEGLELREEHLELEVQVNEGDNGAASLGDAARQLHEQAVQFPQAAPNKDHTTSTDRVAVQAQRGEPAQRLSGETVIMHTSGSLVTFSAGLSIHRNAIMTGSECCCTVLIHGLPPSAQGTDAVRAWIKGFGIRARHFMVRGVTKSGAVEIIGGEDVGRILGQAGEVEVLGSSVSFEIITSRGLSSPESNVLNIAWRASSAHYIVKYCSNLEAKRRAKELHGSIFENHHLRVDVRGAGATVRIRGLPPSVTDADVVALSGSPTLQRLQGGDPGLSAGLRSLRQELRRISPFAIASFGRVTSHGRTEDEMTAMHPRFTSWENAHSAERLLQGRRMEWLGGASCLLDLPAPYTFQVVIPKEQYAVQMSQWDALAESCRGRACALRVDGRPKVKGRVRVEVEGTEEHVVGSFKVRMEALTAGTRVEAWHPVFDSGSEVRRRFEQEIAGATGALVCMDPRRRLLSVFGAAGAIELAHAKIETEIKRLDKTERTTVTLGLDCVGYFVGYGIRVLKEVVGEDGVCFKADSRQLEVAGGEEGRHVLERLIERSIGEGSFPQESGSCPICLDEASAPVQLGCQHIYCASCLRHLLKSAVSFPLVCVGDDARCGRPIPVPVMRLFLPEVSFRRLLEKAFAAYVEKHLKVIAYCRTPGCSQVYRVTPESAPATVKCPSCFSAVCSSCHEEAHSSAKQHGRVKRCPGCSVLIEKVAGCDHVSCRCGAHLCWRCMGTFTADSIYHHIDAAHDADELFPMDIEDDPPADRVHFPRIFAENVLRPPPMVPHLDFGMPERRQQRGRWSGDGLGGCLIM